MRPRWRHVLRIRLAKAAEPPRSIHTLFKAYEAAIRTAANPAAVNRAPGVILGFGRSVERGCNSDNAERKQEKFHGCLASEHNSFDNKMIGWSK
jgi:hypothetical protein